MASKTRRPKEDGQGSGGSGRQGSGSSGPSSNDQFYYADGRRIALQPSPHFVAIQGSSVAAPEAEVASRVSAATGIRPPAVLELPEFDLVVVEVPGGSAAGAAAVLGPLAAAAATQPVYETSETPEAPGGEALIPVGEILVKFKPGVTAARVDELLRQLDLAVERKDYPEPGVYLVRTPRKEETVALANQLHDRDEVAYAEPNFVRLTPRLDEVVAPGSIDTALAGPARGVMPALGTAAGPAAGVPNDPNFVSQWALVKTGAAAAFELSMGNPAVSVAIIDEGCNLTHEDIVYKLPGYDAVTSGANPPEPQPTDGHGTACGGIVAASANNGKGGVGVAPNCTILPVRIARRVGAYWATNSAMIADGIRKAVDLGADVLSNSWYTSPSTLVTNAFTHAQTNGRGGLGCPIAIATGNGDLPSVTYPSALSPTIPGLLAVGASNEWDQRKSKTSADGETWWGSNYGPEVDVVAPGVHIFTTDIMGTGGYTGGNYMPNFNGTSSATPHVAGLMALLVSVDPGLRSWEVEEIVKRTADDLGAPGRDNEFGYGRINCRRALEAVMRLWYEVSVVPEFIGAGRECFMRLNARVYNSGINTVRLDSLTLTSHSADWSAEIDRVENLPNPGGTMAPGQDVLLKNVLLKANGTEASWSYRWSINWTYTFWRPSAPGVPLAAPASAGGRTEKSNQVRGGADKQVQPGADFNLAPTTSDNGAQGDTITVDRQTRAITIVIR
jgi:hypothetical protein